jgi:TonB family protein
MNRLQKKCLIATAGFHLLLLVILFVGPAFFWSREQPDTSPVLEMIPASVVDTASTGVQSPQPPPAPAPIVTPPQPPTPPAPQPVVQPAPVPQKIEPVKPDLVPVVKPSETKPPTPKISLQLVTHDVPKISIPTKTQNDSQAKLRALALKAARALKNNLAPTTAVDVPGDSSATSANYAQVVKSIYEQAWTPPDDAENDDANARVSVTISSDGAVITARILTPSGDKGVDDTVQRTLDRVQFIAPFPSGSTDKERTYIINFNLKAKRMLG